jgi:hypothetical protein
MVHGTSNFAHKLRVLGMSQELGSLLPEKFRKKPILIRWTDVKGAAAYSQP